MSCHENGDVQQEREVMKSGTLSCLMREAMPHKAMNKIFTERVIFQTLDGGQGRK